MISNLNPATRISARNHPENAPSQAPPAAPGMGSIVALCMLCGLVGMTFGTVALSTAMQAEGWGELISSVPIIIAAVALLSGWTGAFYCMIREERASKKG